MEAEAEATELFFFKLEAEAEAPSKSTASKSLLPPLSSIRLAMLTNTLNKKDALVNRRLYYHVIYSLKDSFKSLLIIPCAIDYLKDFFRIF